MGNPYPGGERSDGAIPVGDDESHSRERTAYSAFRGGFRPGSDVPPHWDDLPNWMRDVVAVAYAQGKLDADGRHLRMETALRVIVEGRASKWEMTAIAAKALEP